MKKLMELGIILAVVGLAAPKAAADQPQRLGYDQFIEKVRQGQVTSVSLGPLYYLEGTYQDGEKQVAFYSQRPLEPGSDILLTELLAAQKVSVVKKEPPQPSTGQWLAQVASEQLVPLVLAVLVVLVLIYVVRINNKIDQVIIK